MKSIPGFDGYWATDMGEIVSDLSGELLILKQRTVKGYQLVTMSCLATGKRQRVRMQVHRLVAMAYHGLPLDMQHCRHLNGISTDNRPSNLAWGSAVDNARDAIRHGTLGPGMKARNRKLTDTQVLEIRARCASGESHAKLSVEYGISQGYIPILVKGHAWSCLDKNISQIA